MKVDWLFSMSTQDPILVKKIQSLGPNVKVEGFANTHLIHVLEDDPAFNEIRSIFEQAKNTEACVIESCTISYSEKERLSAKWLRIRSMYDGVDNGHDDWGISYANKHASGRKHVILGKESTKEIYEHTIQIAPLQTTVVPKWRANRQFCTDLYSGISLCCSDVAKRVIEESRMTGAKFCPVLSASTRIPLPNVWQICPKECENFLAPGPYINTSTCRVCGQTLYSHKIIGRGELRIQEDRIPKGLDFMQTPPLVNGRPFYVISQRAYQVLKEAQITRALVFEPLSGTGDG